MDKAFHRMWDLPSSLIYCRSMIWVFPGSFECISPITTGTVVVFILNIRSISISRSLYLDSFSTTFTEMFSQSRWTCPWVGNVNLSFFVCFVFDSNIWSVGFYLTICLCCHTIVVSPPFNTAWGSCSYHLSFVLILNSLQIFQCRYVTASLNVFRLG